MEKLYAEKIENLLSDYFEYRKAKEEENGKKKGTSAQNAIIGEVQTRADFKWFPTPLPANGQQYKNNGVPMEQPFAAPAGNVNPPQNGQPNPPVNPISPETEEQYAKALGDDVSKKLAPYAKQEVERMDYEGSPIYDELDKETISQMTSAAYNNAVQNVPELGDLETDGQRAYFTKQQIVKSLIREILIRQIFLLKRPWLLR